ncbi:S-adenosylmethionine carrier 1, chloroplastic/mitochondrial-like isoform X2 [Durio zibethinus]|uniref:S-adenosylmethionine carrier 1, chloroplastic/mitochondrial-like isoform X2 n=1 Tax=Durio zibethinus TaxID=66656 RepID=A0A6P5ZCG4_DURZI|nr:S-adenosylmethionine carrier 1, chloroplastic/mitochondrial-like isoform X2 [Durio zibethinus]
MDPQTVSSNVSTSQKISPDGLRYKKRGTQKEGKRLLGSVRVGDENPFDFFRVFYESVIAGATAGVVVEATLYPIDTIKTRLQTAGALGGAASSLVRVPTEVVKQRMQTGQFSSATAAVRLIVAKEGFKGLYAGYGSFLLRDLPFDAIQFCIYEQLRIGYKRGAQRDLNDPENAILGAFAGAITGAVTTPLDVIKTRLMVQGSAKQYKGIFDCVRTIMKEEGSHALLKGIGPRVLWIGLGGSIFFGVLEKTKQLLAERHPENQKSFSLKQN